MSPIIKQLAYAKNVKKYFKKTSYDLFYTCYELF